MKHRYFLRDPQGRYRGLFNVTETHVDRLRAKGWKAIKASTRFGREHPWKSSKSSK